MKKIWITWEKHRRTSGLVAALGDVKLFEFELEAHRLIRYPCLLFQTASTLIKKKPDVVIVQNPSIVLALCMILFGKLLVRYVVVDAHNAGLNPSSYKYNWLMPIYRLIQRQADLTIVTNKQLAKEVQNNGGNPFILEDKIPQFRQTNRIKLTGNFNFVFVCTFAKDEPYRVVVNAAKLISPSIYVYITGNYQKVSHDIIHQAPSNVVFTGFLYEQEYIDLLNSSDAIIDLTSRENCLVCGAYEAVSLGKPIILSDTPALRNYFFKGTIYTKNNTKAIAKAVQEVIKNRHRLQLEIMDLRAQLRKEWGGKSSQFLSILNGFQNK